LIVARFGAVAGIGDPGRLEAGFSATGISDAGYNFTNYWVTVTGVPTEACSKNSAAIRPGKRMQP
jgi:hypothetical protein